MGISGLLPAIKSIQLTKHYAGQAGHWKEDAQVSSDPHYLGWDLKKGGDLVQLFSICHHQDFCQPYIAFDGALPAKKGTEHKRKQKHNKNPAWGNTLIAQGKHSQAWEFYLKCVDVTPQMVFQFIKVPS
ncbi:hypothetical protein BYT27DRAFT_7248937 [Phlegmacium glaucopus]|nr:hypothetical protein BYT27DRAFT_7248937 [Phlegmacium glaucopus]